MFKDWILLRIFEFTCFFMNCISQIFMILVCMLIYTCCDACAEVRGSRGSQLALFTLWVPRIERRLAACWSTFTYWTILLAQFYFSFFYNVVRRMGHAWICVEDRGQLVECFLLCGNPGSLIQGSQGPAWQVLPTEPFCLSLCFSRLHFVCDRLM